MRGKEYYSNEEIESVGLVKRIVTSCYLYYRKNNDIYIFDKEPKVIDETLKYQLQIAIRELDK